MIYFFQHTSILDLSFLHCLRTSSTKPNTFVLLLLHLQIACSNYQWRTQVLPVKTDSVEVSAVDVASKFFFFCFLSDILVIYLLEL